MGPLYGVDGNLLVEDIVFPRYLVEDILDDRFKPQFAMEGMLIWAVFQKYPHLEFELEKRRHHKTYKAHLKAKLEALKVERRRLYGVDGNLLLENPEFPLELVEAILSDIFETSFPNQGMLYRAVLQKYPQLERESQKRRHRRWLEMSRKLAPGVMAPPLGNGPLYGVDGNLIADLDFRFSRSQIESILNGTFKAVYLIKNMLPGVVYRHYPQLRDEREKRDHRKAYRAHLEAKRHLLSSPRP